MVAPDPDRFDRAVGIAAALLIAAVLVLTLLVFATLYLVAARM